MREWLYYQVTCEWTAILALTQATCKDDVCLWISWACRGIIQLKSDKIIQFMSVYDVIKVYSI